MELKHPSRTLDNANEINKAILKGALGDHDKHYWCICKYIEREMKKSKYRRRWYSGPQAIGELFGTGHTVATVIWETYTGAQS